MTDLRSCPFCGAEAVLSNTRVDAETSWWNVGCHNCDAQALPFAQKLVAVLTWNTRHTPIDRDCPQERFNSPFARPSTLPAVSDEALVDALAKALCLLDSFAGEGLGHVYDNCQTIDAEDVCIELAAAVGLECEPGWWRTAANKIARSLTTEVGEGKGADNG